MNYKLLIGIISVLITISCVVTYFATINSNKCEVCKECEPCKCQVCPEPVIQQPCPACNCQICPPPVRCDPCPICT